MIIDREEARLNAWWTVTMRFSHQSTTSQRLRRLCELGALAIIQVLAVGCCGGDAAPDATACDRSPCVRELAVGSTHACARLDDGTVRCWGANTYGQVGADHTDLESRPTAVRLGAKADKLRLGAQTSCAFASGQLSCWGRNADFGAGPGVWADDTAYPLPLPVPNPKITDIGLGRDVFCTLSSDGEVSCVGNGAYGNTGLGSDVPPVPVLTPIPGLHASALSVGYAATCATLQGGGVSCWGDNVDSLIGPEADTGRAIESPRAVPELADLRELRLSLDLGCGVSKQQVRCWGANQSANTGANGPGPVWASQLGCRQRRPDATIDQTPLLVRSAPKATSSAGAATKTHSSEPAAPIRTNTRCPRRLSA